MILHNRPTIGSLEIQAVEKVIQSGQLSHSVEVKKFEEEFANYLGLNEGAAVAMCNGTAHSI